MTVRILITCRQMQMSMGLFADRLKSLGVEWVAPEIPGQQFSAEQLKAIVGGYDAVIAGDDEVSAEVLRAGLPRMRVVAKWGIGVDGIDLAAASELGIEVTNTPAMFDGEVADVALGYILSLLRGLHHVDRVVRSGGWPKFEGRSSAGKTVGVVGLGGTGRALASRVQALGMTVVGVEPHPPNAELAVKLGVQMVGLEELTDRSDIISLHCPLTPATTGLISADLLSKMRAGVLIVNTSRGRVIDEAALIEALRRGRVGGAALDVFEVEPLPEDSPLRALDNVILGSHNASNTAEAVARASERALENALIGLGVL